MAGQVGNEDGDVGFQIAPMVDVVFVLMLFFMASAGVQMAERELAVNLPSGATTASDLPRTPIIIEISGDNQVRMNTQLYDTPASKGLPDLRLRLRDLMDRFGGKDPVIIRPAPDVRHERVVDVLNAAAAAGVKHLTFG